jgi:uncharacterized protein YdeI (YjbR/CyaY-like superfamily)
VDVGDDRAAWRAWLKANHKAAKEAWLVRPLAASGRPSLAYGAAVEEALCFGWIDSQQKAIGKDLLAQRFTPRRKGSALSEMNRQRVVRMVAAGKMTKAGLAGLGDFDPAAKPKPLRIPADLARALRAEKAWAKFQAMPEDYRRLRVAYVEAGRRHGADQVAKRIRNLVAKTAAGKRVGSDRTV